MTRYFSALCLVGSLVSFAAIQGCDPADPEGAAGAAGMAGAAGSGGSDAGSGGSDAGSGGSAGEAGSGGSGSTAPKVALCGETSACTRPTDTPLSAPYLGASGELGCAINARCTVAVGNNQGKCIPVGCTKETGDPTVPATLNGTATCNVPVEFSFEGKASEVYRFQATITVPGQGGGGVNAGAVLLRDGTPVQQSGVDVGFYGNPIPGEPLVDERTYNLRTSGTYTWRVFVDQCEQVSITGSVTRKAEAEPNLTQQTATPLAAGSAPTGTLNCEEERWFILSPTAGQKLKFSLSGSSTLPNAVGTAEALLLDGALQPLSESGSDVAVYANVSTEAPVVESREVTFENGGVHYLRLRFSNGCTIGTYQLSVTAP